MYTSWDTFYERQEDSSCGEDNVHEWIWDEKHLTPTTVITNNGLQCNFNNGYSSGTAAVRGTEFFEKGRHHYFEVKMLSSVYGTDIMIGVGTSKVDFNNTVVTFCSLLGSDEESFGFSYNGYIQHRGKKRLYGGGFEQGSVVGVHLDMWRGTLQFFLNRNPLGIAFVGLQDMTLYPMVSSTVANSKLRLMYSCSMPVSLQTECLALLQPKHKAYLSILPGLRHLAQNIFAEILKKEPDPDDKEVEIPPLCPPECMILDEYDFVLVGIGRRKIKENRHKTVNK